LGGPVVAIVPSRFASTRFPGKPLALIDGLPMVVRVLSQAARAQTIDQVYAATDDERIAQTVRQAGFQAFMTSPNCANGTERIWEALAKIDGDTPSLVVNVQGDEPIIDPADIDCLVKETLKSGRPMGTLARAFPELDRFDDPNVVKVVCAQDGRALYFSRAAIPHSAPQPLMHVGLYAYVPPTLKRLSTTPPTALESCERLEQLRALEIGIEIHVAMAASKQCSIAVDIPEDIARVEAALNQIKTNEVDCA